jgi:hypothetical protein
MGDVLRMTEEKRNLEGKQSRNDLGVDGWKNNVKIDLKERA